MPRALMCFANCVTGHWLGCEVRVVAFCLHLLCCHCSLFVQCVCTQKDRSCCRMPSANTMTFENLMCRCVHELLEFYSSANVKQSLTDVASLTAHPACSASQDFALRSCFLGGVDRCSTSIWRQLRLRSCVSPALSLVMT